MPPWDEEGRVAQYGSGPGAGPGRVRPLPEALIDQIAAGEVVERPASVVKELVENSLDAGARELRIEVRGGGRDWIAVSDDGTGMDPADARLALQRHATSKIASADDLQRIASYGFRGEALPAIASVSRLRLRTRTRQSPSGWEIRVEAGRLVEEGEAAGPPGTRVEVADLFAAVPARRKFLKSVATEWGHLSDWLARSALARPDVHFEVRRDDRPAFAWPAVSDPLERVAAVIGEEEAAALVAVDLALGPLRVAGFASRPDRHRPNLGAIHLFVNGRAVRDRVLQHALVDVYRDVLPRGRFPSAVLFLELPAEQVDVNVHPAKWEVRFADPQAVHRAVRAAVSRGLEGRRWLGAPAAVREASAPEAVGEGGASWPARTAAGSGQGDWVFAAPARGGDAAASAVDRAPESGPRPALRFAEQRLLGQALATYLVLETGQGLLLVDQHAAHERVLYERLRLEWRERSVASQGLLVPVPVSLDPASGAALADALPGLGRLGFDVEPFGDSSFAVRGIPALLAGCDPADLLRELAAELAAGEARGLAGERPSLAAADRLFAGLACHAARRKGELLPPPEQQALLAALDAIPWAPTCPHGRPVAVPVEIAELERRFARR
jgi:DNA mismatch repair protein MutL